MSIWDWLIFLCVIGQIITVIGLVMAALKIKNGLVRNATDRGKTLTAKGMALATTSQRLFEQTLPRLSHMQTELTEMGAELRKNAEFAQTATSGLREAAQGWAQVQAGIGTAKTGINALRQMRMVARKANLPRDRRPSPPRRSIAHRLGLVPPVVQKVERFLPLIRQGIALARTLRQGSSKP